MRILKVSQFYYPAVSFGGLVSAVQGMAEGLAKRGHTVVVLTSNLLDLHHKVSGQTITQQVNGVTVVYLRTLLQSRVTTINPGILLFSARHVHEFDVIHIYGYYNLLAPFVCYFARKRGIPYVFEPSGMLVPMLRSLNRKRIYHRIFGKTILDGANKVIATSRYEAERLTRAGVNEACIVVRHIGVDLPLDSRSQINHRQLRHRLGITDEERIVLFLGRICPVKRLDLLLLAFSELSLPDTKLVIVGPAEDDKYVEHLKKMQSELGLSQRVIFPGPLFGQDKVAALASADIFVLPSEHENFGIAAVEAIAVGTPVIITQECGVAPHLRDRVGLVVRPDYRELRDAMAELLTNQKLHNAFRSNCLSVAAEFGWEGPLALMERLYTELLKGQLKCI